MSEGFSQTARSLWPPAAQLLSWRPDEFWRATPEELVSALAATPQSQTNPITRDAISEMMELERNG